MKASICTFCVLFTKYKTAAHFNLLCSWWGPEPTFGEQTLSEGLTDPFSHNGQGLRDQVFGILLFWSPFFNLQNKMITVLLAGSVSFWNANVLSPKIHPAYLLCVAVNKVWYWCNNIHTCYRNIWKVLGVWIWFDSLAELLQQLHCCCEASSPVILSKTTVNKGKNIKALQMLTGHKVKHERKCVHFHDVNIFKEIKWCPHFTSHDGMHFMISTAKQSSRIWIEQKHDKCLKSEKELSLTTWPHDSALKKCSTVLNGISPVHFLNEMSLDVR